MSYLLPRLPRLSLLSAITSVVLSAAAPLVAAQSSLPAPVRAAFAQARIPLDAVSVVVRDLDASGSSGHSTMRWRDQVPMNPASTMKLLTTFAALDQLGPAYTWATPVYTDGTVRDGTLQGNLYIRGSGDPKLVLEQLWLLLRSVQGLGIRSIAGDLVLDHSAFALPPQDPASFDGESLRPYNVIPDALLVNFNSVAITLRPGIPSDKTPGYASLQYDPPLAGVELPERVPLSSTATNSTAGDCGDYRSALQSDWSDPQRLRWRGSYSAACGEKVWPFAYPAPADYAPRAVLGLWQSMGGTLTGKARWGNVPDKLLQQPPALVHRSPPLSEVVRDINKFSNNVMAQQVFLSLPLATQKETDTGPSPAPSNWTKAQATLLTWWRERVDPQHLWAEPVVENGSGLSRQERISAAAMAHLLERAYRSAVMPELMASLPIWGQDGTLRHVLTPLDKSTQASAHIKTGSLSNVLARAGYVLGASGHRYAVVVMVNHPQAASAKTAVETLLQGLMQDTP